MKIFSKKQNANFYFKRGNNYLEQKEYELALADFNEAIKLNNNFAKAYLNRGICYFELEKYDAAIADFDKSFKILPYIDYSIFLFLLSPIPHNINVPAHGVKVQLLPFIATLFPLIIVLSPLIFCYILYRKIRYEKIHAKLYFFRGVCYLKLQKYEQAFFDFNHAIEIDSEYSQAYVGRAECYLKNKSYESAIKDFNKSIELNHITSDIYSNLGLCYLGLKKYEKSLQNCDSAIKLNPLDSKAYNNRGLCRLEQEKLLSTNFSYIPSFIGLTEAIALNDFNKAVELDPNDASIYNNRGIYYTKQKKYDLAMLDYNKAIELNPNYAQAYNNRGICYSELKNYDLALSDFDTTLNLFDPPKLNPTVTAINPIGVLATAATAATAATVTVGVLDSKLVTFTTKIDLSEDKKQCCFLASNVAVTAKKYNEAKNYIEKAFEYADSKERLQHKDTYLNSIERIEAGQLALEETNKRLELENQQKQEALEREKALHKQLHEKEKEMLSFFTHTMRNALATAPESLRQAIRLLGSEDYESNQKHYKAINKIAALFSTLSLTDCLIDTFKQSISEPEEFQRAWQNDNEGEATPKWVIAAALRQSLNRIIFMSDTSELRQLLNHADTPAIVAMRKSFIDNILPLNLDNQGIAAFYQWLSSITTLEIAIENHDLHFGVNQVKFSLLFAISSELILNALKYWNGNGKIQIRWYTEQEQFIFKVTNACETNASSSLAGTHKGIAFIKRLMELLGEQAQFNCAVEEQLFIAELKLHQSLLEHNA